MNTDTILMGDATNVSVHLEIGRIIVDSFLKPPIIKAAAGFSGEQTLINGNLMS